MIWYHKTKTKTLALDKTETHSLAHSEVSCSLLIVYQSDLSLWPINNFLIIIFANLKLQNDKNDWHIFRLKNYAYIFLLFKELLLFKNIYSKIR